MIKIAINGFGRIGRLLFRQICDDERLEIVAINDLGDLANLAYLLKYDTVYRGFPGEIKTAQKGGKNYLVVDDKEILVLQEKDPTKLPWKELGVDIVVEATGVFESFEKAKVHLDAGAKRVVLTAPAKDAEGTDGGRTVLIGINDGEITSTVLTSNGSCTTNAVAPVIEVLKENPGIEKAVLNTVHALTNTQTIVDSPVKGNDFRRGRAGAHNMVPSTTGAAKTVGKVIKEVDGKFDGIAIRVPIVCGSIADITFISEKKTSVEEINEIFRKAAKSEKWQGILQVSEDPIVSSDVIGIDAASLVDLPFTKVVDGNLVKVLAWYDNEWGYVTTLVNHILKAGESL
ncbi:MAG: type I glyceraldehyde-3-phosphate dehydrogenase [Candidatus Paceibacterota bacterium]|jgi:glyceraldehyde 3-phosphate dehydrogenase